ncbi:hypothetical protein [Ketobacter sp.]|uniref:hypothetical protein n=1 Tax=Ketobacter sp. TaxID=2083498 RepID=UPI0025C17CB2|nr:hypothetical protein [Ketobacter sp.]
MNVISKILLLTAALGLAACDQASIVAPTNNSSQIVKPEYFIVNFTNGDVPSPLQLEINGKDVKNAFTAADDGASMTASSDDVETFCAAEYAGDCIVSGRNVFRMTAGTTLKQVVFYYDTTGPQIRITGTDRDARTVSGYVYDPGGVTSVFLDDAAVTLDASNHFTDVPYNDQPRNVFVATDGFNHTSTTTFSRNDTEYTGLSAYLSDAGLQFIIPTLEQVLSEQDLTPILGALGPINIDVPIVLLGDFRATMTVNELGMDNLDLDLSLVDDGLDLSKLYAENLEVGLTLDSVSYKSLVTLGMWVTIPLKADVTVTTDGNPGYIQASTLVDLDVVDRNVSLDTSGTTLATSDLDVAIVWLDNGGLLSNVLSAIADVVVDILLRWFDTLLLTIVDYMVDWLMSAVLNEIGIGLNVDVDGEEGPVTPLAVNAVPDTLNNDANGLTVRLATNAKAPTPATFVPATLGSLHIGGTAPIMTGLTPDGSGYDFGVGLSTNVLNQILAAAHDSGLTTIQLAPGFYPSLVDGTQTLTDLPEGTLIGIRLMPKSAPYMTLGDAGAGAAGTLHWYDVEFALDMYVEGWDDYRTVFGATLNIDVPFIVDSTFGGNLGLAFDQVPVIEVTQTDASGLLPLPPGFINSIVEFAVPLALPMLGDALQAIPLPSILGHVLFMEQFWVDNSGNGQNHTLALAGRLIHEETALNAAAPTTYIGTVTYSQTTVEMESVNNGTVTVTSIDLENGAVDIAISGNNPNPEFGGLQYRYQVDGGSWSAWMERTNVVVDSFLAGDHTVKVCARSSLMKEEAEETCPVVSFTTTEIVPAP